MEFNKRSPPLRQILSTTPQLRTFDLSAHYPISAGRFHEGLSIVPGIAVYNVFNMSNFNPIPNIPDSATGTLLNTTDAGSPGYFNGPKHPDGARPGADHAQLGHV